MMMIIIIKYLLKKTLKIGVELVLPYYIEFRNYKPIYIIIDPFRV